MTGGSTASGRARLVDVAQRAGVSTATVSLVLRGRPGPSRATADAVRAAAADLGYRPDRTAGLLARHRSHLLGVLLDVSSPFHAELVRRSTARRPTAGSTSCSAPPRHAPTTPGGRDAARLPLRGTGAARPPDGRCRPDRPRVAVPDRGRRSRRGRGRHRGAGRRRPGAGGGRRPPGVAGAPSHRVRRRTAGQHRPGAPSRGTATPWLGTACGSHSDVIPGGATRRPESLPLGAGSTDPSPTTDGRWSASTTASRSGFATPCCARAVVCPNSSRSSATTTARWPGSAPSTNAMRRCPSDDQVLDGRLSPGRRPPRTRDVRAARGPWPRSGPARQRGELGVGHRGPSSSRASQRKSRRDSTARRSSRVASAG